MSDSLNVNLWELRVEHLPGGKVSKTQFFLHLNNAKNMAATWANSSHIHWESADDGKTWVGCSYEFKDRVFCIREQSVPWLEAHLPLIDRGEYHEYLQKLDIPTLIEDVFYGGSAKLKGSKDELVRHIDHIKRLAVASEFLYMAEVQLMHASDSLEGLRTLKALRGIVAIEDAEKNIEVAIKLVNSELEALEEKGEDE